MSLDLPDFNPGDELRASDLNRIVAWIRANELSAMPGGGLIAVKHGGGQSWRALPLDRGDWFMIQSHVSGNHYKIRRQVDDPGGAWSDADSLDLDGYEANGVSSLPNGLVDWFEPAGGKLKNAKGIC